MNATESRYVESRQATLRLAHDREPAPAAETRRLEHGFDSEGEWMRCVREDFPKFVPFLRRAGLNFRGRVLEIGAGAAWFSAELSKLPGVVEIVTTDLSPRRLKEDAPKIFKLLKAREGKITRMPADFHKLDFPDNHFDFVVGSAVLHHALNIGMVLREARRVLKPGGQFVLIREPVRPLMSSQRRQKRAVPDPRAPVRTLAEFGELFERAGFKLEVKRVNLAAGFKYYFDKLVNGFTHARYAFVATKKGRA